ncbi:hypothetical protein BJ912DRAFT_935673 [Pholiota molesta]|nr:hypothetical protein BJ912DRAFT_935673 [Pholiota molesta]
MLSLNSTASLPPLSLASSPLCQGDEKPREDPTRGRSQSSSLDEPNNEPARPPLSPLAWPSPSSSPSTPPPPSTLPQLHVPAESHDEHTTLTATASPSTAKQCPPWVPDSEQLPVAALDSERNDHERSEWAARGLRIRDRRGRRGAPPEADTTGTGSGKFATGTVAAHLESTSMPRARTTPCQYDDDDAPTATSAPPATADTNPTTRRRQVETTQTDTPTDTMGTAAGARCHASTSGYGEGSGDEAKHGHGNDGHAMRVRRTHARSMYMGASGGTHGARARTGTASQAHAQERRAECTHAWGMGASAACAW